MPFELTPVVCVRNLGEENAEYPMSKQQARLAVKLLEIIYQGRSPQYDALAAIVNKSADLSACEHHIRPRPHPAGDQGPPRDNALRSAFSIKRNNRLMTHIPFKLTTEQEHAISSFAVTCNYFGTLLKLLAGKLEPNLPGVTARLEQAIGALDSAGIPAEVLDMRRELLHGFSGGWSAENKRAKENGSDAPQ